MSSLDLLSIGRVSVDLYAEQPGVTMSDVTTFRKSIGGTATNVAVATAPTTIWSVAIVDVVSTSLSWLSCVVAATFDGPTLL